MPTVLPQPVGDHSTAQGLARHRTAVMLGQLLRRQEPAPAKAGVGPKSECRSCTIDSARVRTSAGSRWLLGLPRRLERHWGAPDVIGHYVDFWSAVLGLTMFPAGYLCHALTKRHGSTRF